MAMINEEKHNIIRRFFSRRNKVMLCERNGVCYVRKIYKNSEWAQRERDCYALLRSKNVRVPIPLFKGPKELHLTYIRGMTALDLLEKQEDECSPCFEPWKTLTLWCCDFYHKSGLVLGDPNLRNFIIESDSGHWFGIDFECSTIGNYGQDFAKLLAFLLCYSPENTELKQQISNEMKNLFSREMSFDRKHLEELQEAARANLIKERKMKNIKM